MANSPKIEEKPLSPTLKDWKEGYEFGVEQGW